MLNYCLDGFIAINDKLKVFHVDVNACEFTPFLLPVSFFCDVFIILCFVMFTFLGYYLIFGIMF